MQRLRHREPILQNAMMSLGQRDTNYVPLAAFGLMDTEARNEVITVENSLS